MKRRETYAGKNCVREKILLLGYKTLAKKRAENHAEQIHYLNVFRTRNESHGCSHQGEDLKVVTAIQDLCICYCATKLKFKNN